MEQPSLVEAMCRLEWAIQNGRADDAARFARKVASIRGDDGRGEDQVVPSITIDETKAQEKALREFQAYLIRKEGMTPVEAMAALRANCRSVDDVRRWRSSAPLVLRD